MNTHPPLPIYTIPRHTIESVVGTSPPIPGEALANYLESRPGILDDNGIDIFWPNCRSAGKKTRFDLFQHVNHVEPGTVVLLPFWLELFQEHCPQNISKCLQWVNETYPNNVVVTQWNHDKDSALVEEFCLMDPARFLLLTFNVSKPRPCDLPCPFWTIDTSRPRNERIRKYKANFLGQAQGQLRQSLKFAVHNRAGYYWSDDRLPESEYLDVLSDSWFTLCPRGGGLASYRQYEAIQVESVPVIFADDAYLPFSDTIDYSKFSIRIPERLAGDFGAIEAVLDAADCRKMAHACAEIRPRLALAGIQMRAYQKLRGMLK